MGRPARSYGPARYRNLAYREGVHPVPKYLYSALKAPNRILGRKVMPPVDPNVYLSHPVNPQVPTARSGPSGRRVKPDHVNLELAAMSLRSTGLVDLEEEGIRESLVILHALKLWTWQSTGSMHC